MHQSEFNLKEYLQAFNIIVSKGTKVENHYSLLEVNAWHDFDGYTCFLGYKDLTLTLLFHGRYSFEFEHKETLTAFLALLSSLLKGDFHD